MELVLDAAKSPSLPRQDRIPELLASIDLAQLVEELGGSFPVSIKNGKALFRCPFPDHADNNPSFTVDLVGEHANRWVCSSRCGSGDAIHLWERFYGCSKSQAIDELARRAGVTEPEPITEINRTVLQLAARHYFKSLTPEVLKWLRGPERLYSLDTIDKFQFGYADGSLKEFLERQGFTAKDLEDSHLFIHSKNTNKLEEVLRDMVTIPYFENGMCVDIRGRTFPYDPAIHKNKYRTLHGRVPRLFNIDVVWHEEDCLLAEGEADTALLVQLGFKAAGVPGANIWKDNWDEALKDAKQIYLIFDSDEAGQKAAQKLRGRLGPRVTPVVLPAKDVTEWVAQGHGALELQEILRRATLAHLFTAADAADAWAKTNGVGGIKFGVEVLDRAIAPGLLPSQIMVVLAKTGEGKTEILLNLMQRILGTPGQEDLGFLYLSLEETAAQWWDRAKKIYRFYNIHDNDQDAVKFWSSRILVDGRNRISEEDVVDSVNRYERYMKKRPDVILLDYLGYWAQAFKGDRYQRTSDASMMLKAIAKDLEIPIITPHQSNRSAGHGEKLDLDAARDSGSVTECADFVFTLYSQDSLKGRSEEERTGIVQLDIGKSRHGGKGTKVEFRRAPLSCCLVPLDESQFDHMARLERKWQNEYHETWEDAVYRHRTGIVAGKIQRP